MTGKLITFEGPEGSGKSTQIIRLAEKLEAQGHTVVCAREPGGTKMGEAIRTILQHDSVDERLADRAELLLFAASRAQLMEQVILPALTRGDWVLCDRFIDSTLAYQGFARGMSIDVLDAVNQFAIQGRMPDITLLLDLDVACGFQRLEERYADGKGAADRFEREHRDFHLRVREGYLKLVDREPNRFRVIPADQSIDAVSDLVWDAVQGVF